MKFIAVPFAALSTLILGGLSAQALEAPPVVVKELSKAIANDVGQPIRQPRGKLQLVVSTYDIAAGAKLPQHKHPYQRYAYVLQGELNVVQVGRSARIYKAGEFIAESVNRWHYGETFGSVPVKLLVIVQLPPGKASTLLRDKL